MLLCSPLWFSTLDDDACAQDTDDNAVPNGLDCYNTPEGFEMVSLYCVLSYMNCLIELTALKPYNFLYNNCVCMCVQIIYIATT